MASAPAPKYTYAIPSLSQTIPNLPALGNLDVNRAIFPNTAIDPENLVNAKLVAKKLEATHKSAVNPGVTEDMVEAANLRLRAVEGAHVAAKYAPDLMTGITTILQRLETIEGSLATAKTDISTMKTDIKINKAVTLNQRIISRNAQNQPAFEALYKTVLGSGFELAREIALRSKSAQAEIRYLSLDAPAEPPASVGTQPPNFSADIMSYTDSDIYDLITFYNETFGIVAEDDLAARRIKLVKFLSDY